MNTMRTALARARGLGSAKDGVGHWWAQRVTAVALVPLSVWFLWQLACLAGADYATVRATVAKPHVAVLLMALIVCLFYHGKLGLQVIIEDYVHDKATAVSLLLAVSLAGFLAAIAGCVAVLRIVLGQP